MIPVPPAPSPGDPAASADASPSRPRRRRLPLIVAAGSLAVTLGAGHTLMPAGRIPAGPAVPVAAGDGAVEEAMPAPPTTVTTMAAPVAAPAPRTAPEQPPVDERAATPLVQVGEIRIPKIGLVHPVYEGVTLTVIDHGPGHWPGSAMPGQLGNAVFAGHRVTHSHPFRHVDRLAAGDEILLSTAQGEFRYTVTRTEIVGSRDTWIVDPTPDATLTLFACHPPGSAKQRIVVRGVYAGPAGRDQLAAPAR